MLNPMPGSRAGLLLPLLLSMALFHPARAAAQSDTVVVVAGERYEAGGLKAFLLGRDYRDLWTTPIAVPVLDLSSYAGGLTPVERGSGMQTVSLRFRAPDGREYNFRSVDKDQEGGMHPDFHGTIVSRIAQDQVSSKHPAGAMMMAPLLDAAGIMHPDPHLFVMPDDPRLGEFREEFAGMLGSIEVHPDEGEDDAALFEDAIRVAGTDRLLEHLEESPENRADARTYLRARLVDMLVGDWDRHVGQWRWARYDREDTRWWVPVPEDRDNAFSRYDGLVMDMVRTRSPLLVEFGPEYPEVYGLTENAQTLDRRLLSELPASAYEEVARDLMGRITDDVIAEAVSRVPPEYAELRAEELAAALRARRDALPDIARAFYAQHAREAEVHATDENELAVIDRTPDGGVEVRLYLAEDGEQSTPYYRRAFRPSETREVRLDLRGGEDRAVIRGEGRRGVLVRVIGGGGDDTLADSSVIRGRAANAFYDHRGDNELLPGRGTMVDTREFDEPASTTTGFNENAPSFRDWGTTFSWFEPHAAWRYNIGPVVGGGPRSTRYGFRRAPHARTIAARLLYAPLENRWGVEADGEYRLTNSHSRTSFRAYASGLETTRFHGYGNDTGGAGSAELYKVPEVTFGIEPLYHLGFGPRTEVFAGPVARFSRPEPEAGGPAADLQPLGIDDFWRLGGQLGASTDTRDAEAYPTRGARLRVAATGFAPAGDLPDPFGGVDGTGSAYLRLPLPLDPVLAVRAGGRLAWGTIPFQEAAYLGGQSTLRGYPSQRWAGDAAVFAGAELRSYLTRFKFITRGDMGVIALADAGRVYVDGESPGGWHTGFGGGLWFGILDRTRTFSVVAAHGEETAFYVTMGMPF